MLLLYHLKPSPMSPVQKNYPSSGNTVSCNAAIWDHVGISGGFYEALMACNVEGYLFWQTPCDRIASVCTYLAELATEEREGAFLPPYQMARR